MWLQRMYKNYTPEQIVRAYHDALIERNTDAVYSLAYSNNMQQNIPELSDTGLLLFMWTDSVIILQTKAHVYSTFKYYTFGFDGELMIMCVRIRETLYHEKNIWQVGLGKVIDIGCLHRIKNIDYINIGV